MLHNLLSSSSQRLKEEEKNYFLPLKTVKCKMKCVVVLLNEVFAKPTHTSYLWNTLFRYSGPKIRSFQSSSGQHVSRDCGLSINFIKQHAHCHFHRLHYSPIDAWTKLIFIAVCTLQLLWQIRYCNKRDVGQMVKRCLAWNRYRGSVHRISTSTFLSFEK